MHEPSLTFALAFGAGVLAQLAARAVRIPGIVLLLALGVLLGPDGLGWVQPDALGGGLHGIVGLAVAVILFEGGLNLDFPRLRREQSAIRMLVTGGAAVTAVGGAWTARYVMGFSWELSILFGTLVIVTGPTVVKPLLRNVPLRPRLATVLEAEGVLIDPVGAVVAAVALQLLTGSDAPGFASGLGEFGLRLAIGSGAGALFGLALGGLLRLERVVPEGFENLVCLGAALVLYEGCDLVRSETGILAVTVAGVVVGNMGARIGRDLREFQEPLTVGLIGVLFILLAADVRLEDVRALGWRGAASVAALMFLVRPLDVLLSTARSELDWREKAFLSWVAPRGVVAAAVASLFAAHLDHLQVDGGGAMRALVFLTIAGTVIVQGGTAGFVATLLGVRAPPRDAFVVLGGEELAFALGDVLREGDRRVVFLDANPTHCRAAEERGFPVVMGNALESRTLARARLERARAAVGLTANDQVNVLFAREAREEFGVPETYVAVSRARTGVSDEILAKQQSRVLFDRAKDVERWHVRFRHDAARVEHFRYAAPSEPGADGADGEGDGASLEVAGAARAGSTPGSSDPFILLAVRRGEAWTPMYAAFEPKDGDLAAAALHLPEQEAAWAALAELGWQRAEPEIATAEEA